jgi:hypothetical protein
LVSYSRHHLYDRFPRLEGEAHEITSEPAGYNCIAFIEGRTDQFIDPNGHWPDGVDKPPIGSDQDLPFYKALFESYGYAECPGPDREDGYVKIAVYAMEGVFTHVAIQMPSGRWRSKAGFLHDLIHDGLEALEGGVFTPDARPVLFMRRRRTDEQKDQEWAPILLPGM